ncbi:hypothetical protein [Olivibacter sitiensis]|nr:hypothetical protein [Olivibacter sitiensis]
METTNENNVKVCVWRGYSGTLAYYAIYFKLFFHIVKYGDGSAMKA